MTFMARHFFFFFGGIFLVVGLVLFVAGASAWRTEGRFEENAATARGKVLTREVVRANRNGDTRTKYSVTYRFDVHTGKTLHHTDEVDADVWERLQEQGPVTIEYLRDDPDTSRVAGTSDATVAWVLTGIGGPFSLLGGGVIFFTARRRLEEARLRRDGASAVGTVVAVRETNISINRIPQWRVHYIYKDVRGREHEGKSALLAPDVAARIAPGETAPVRYDRARPERSLWLGPPNV